MFKKILIVGLIVVFSCKNEQNIQNCFSGIKFNELIYLNNPEFLKLTVPGGNVISSLSGRVVLIIRKSSSYKAFDLQCPEKDCDEPMIFDGLKLICSCSKKEYNSLNGSPIDGKGCFALEYNTQINGNTLIISR